MKIKKIEAQPAEKKKLRVAAYCRVSTENDDQKESLEAQKTHYETWIKRHSDWEYVGVFYDLDISGTKADSRDGLQALMYECRIGRIDYVLTKSISRFSRTVIVNYGFSNSIDGLKGYTVISKFFLVPSIYFGCCFSGICQCK